MIIKPEAPSFHSKLLHFIFCCLLLIQFGGSYSDAKPPENNDYQVAFRSVLDGKIRILNIALNEHNWLAYDTDNAQAYKIWQGEVKLDGPVYSHTHGPQPTSEGPDWHEYASADWKLVRGPLPSDNDSRRSEQRLKPKYRGHKFVEGNVVLLYDFETDFGLVKVSETPSVEVKDPGIIFTRRFQVSGLPEAAALSLGEQFRLENGNSSVRERFTSALEEKKDETEKIHPGVQLINGSDCVICHNETRQTVGPSWLSIANRYTNTETNRNLLSRKIIAGSTGAWGNAVMTPHPSLVQEDALSMVDYILSLHDTEDKGEQVTEKDKQTSQEQPLVFRDDMPSPDQEMHGMLLYLYKFLGDPPSASSMQTTSPTKVAQRKQLHLMSLEDFGETQQHIALHTRTHLRIEKDAIYTLRLISDDGSKLFFNGKEVISHWGFHGPEPKDLTLELKAGDYPIEIFYFQGTGGAALSLQWFNKDLNAFEPIPERALILKPEDYRTLVAEAEKIVRKPGDTIPLEGVHPSFDLYQARPESFKPMVGGIDFLEDGRMVVTTWDKQGAVYLVDNFLQKNPKKIKVQRIASGLAEPLGVQVVNNEIYVMQKQELTKLLDMDGDGLIDFYQCVSNDWAATANFHEFGFGLEYRDGHLYAALATAILPGGASAQPQAPDRGKLLKINPQSGETETVAHGLRTPNGIGAGIDNLLFIADNQGDWLPASKIIEVTPGAFYGARSVDFEGTAKLKETLPVVWLPQDEIGNSPSEPIALNIGPYQNQMLHGEVTHGGIKRVSAERINGRLQGAVFRFTQGLEAGVNRLDWAPDGSLIVGGVGNPGNWGHKDKLWYGLQRLVYNNKVTFEMLNIRALADGFEIEFTEAIHPAENITAENFSLEQWRYQPTKEYGGPKIDLQELKISNINLSSDRKRVHLKVAGLKENHIVYFHIAKFFASKTNQNLWSTEAWYTLNSIPKNK